MKIVTLKVLNILDLGDNQKIVAERGLWVSRTKQQSTQISHIDLQNFACIIRCELSQCIAKRFSHHKKNQSMD